MSGRVPSVVGRLIQLGGAATVLAIMLASKTSASTAIADNAPASNQKAQSALPELVTYGVGYAVAFALTIAAFALVHWHLASSWTALAIVFGLALLQIFVHFRCFLHVSLHEPARDDLWLVLFSSLIVLIMVGGTLVILFNLRVRMM